MAQGETVLSIIVPAFNEERRIRPSLNKVLAYLAQQPYPAEVLVVDDGSADGTCALVQDMASREPRLQVVRNEHHGKGYAVKTGMLKARGEFRFICDADLSMPIEQLERFLPPKLDVFDVALASRNTRGSRRIGEPKSRYIISRLFNLYTQMVAVPGITDTQCGFKCFRAEAAVRLFTLQRLEGFGFDVEILFLAQKLGLRVREVPIDWHYGTQSTVRPLRDSLRVFRETLAIRLYDLKGLYDG